MQDKKFQALLIPKHEIISKKLFLGNGTAAEEAIIQATTKPEHPSIAIIRCTFSVSPGEEQAIADGVIRHLNLNVGDKLAKLQTPAEMSEVQTNFDRAYDFIEQAFRDNLPVLVHCDAGASRSASVMVAYMMRSKHISLVQAERAVSHIRACVDVSNFRPVLESYQEKLGIAVRADQEDQPLLEDDNRSFCSTCSIS